MSEEKDISGLLLINKESGPTSHDIIDRLRRITGIKKIGHAGTLDPFAHGLLLCFISRKATRKIGGYMHLNKEYIARIRFGKTTDTYDLEGRITSDSGEIDFSDFLPRLGAVLDQFRGKIEQVPPMYSALKVKGKKLYELARKGVEIERAPRSVEIFELKLVEVMNEPYPVVVVRIQCSTGTYIRSLAHDIGNAMGVGAYLEDLSRTKIGSFELKDALDARTLTQKNIESKLRPA